MTMELHKCLPLCSIFVLKISSSVYENQMEIIWGACISNENALRMYGVSLPECIYECKLRPSCSSINYRVLMRSCELNDNGWSLRTEKCPGTIFSKRVDWTEANFCDSHCQNGTRCDGETETCQIKECQPLIVDHSEIFGNLRRVGNKLLVSCINDDAIVMQVYCLENGSWNQIPVCPANTASTVEECSSYKVSQWVASVTGFSSEYFLDSWSAEQVVGPPDVYPSYGDLPGAWAQDNCYGIEFLDLEFQEAIFIKCVAIYETYHGGKVKAILGRRKNSGSAWETQWHKLWSTTQIQDIKEARIFSPSLNELNFKAKGVRVEVDCTLSGSSYGSYYVEIDAVMIGGYT